MPSARSHHIADTSDEEAGAIEHYLDPALYDHEYRHRRADLNFYRLLADERLGGAEASPLLELACGSGRLTIPLVRAGHTVVAFDRAVGMLMAARHRLSRLPAIRQQRCLLLKADMRRFQLKRPVSLALAGFHSIQHLVKDADLLACFANVRASLIGDGWFVFDVLAPHPLWLENGKEPKWSPRTYRHPVTNQRLRYGTAHAYDEESKALHMRLHYQPVDDAGQVAEPARIVRLCHRQFWPGDLDNLLDQAGFDVLARYSDFKVSASETAESLADTHEEHIYVARPKRASTFPRTR